ncbi:hypothetical protein HOLleu_00898 [Holothuria leucospilota]|uniref:Polyprotein n=1 Tax=Holothuria leucospilota TaxID=206669 RepID=A0A9Q1CMT5_HOLLE|nr:hypothetical protein HOLleu_00898 [Holothuria leucospilota]
MIKYLAKFLPALSDKSEPLRRRLTHKDTKWPWSKEQADSFQIIKQIVTDAPVLKYFDPECHTEGQGDASDKGFGFALLQNDHPATYASRALTQAERNYSQIEKELLALVFGLERNHQYVYGRKVILWIDHKPLVSISQKPLSSAPRRLQRLLLRLHQYDTEIRYKPGTKMLLADTLSRAYLSTNNRSAVEEETEKISMVNFLPVSSSTLKAIQQATEEDSTLPSVNQYIIYGWPNNKHELQPMTHAYFNIRDELSAQDNVLFKGKRCIIPSSLRNDIKDKLPSAHSDIQSTRRREGDSVYWPGMSREIKELIEVCEVCNTFQTEQQKEPLISQKLPDRPWEKVRVDIFIIHNKDYLCIVDYYSDLFEVDNLYFKKNAQSVIKLLRNTFLTMEYLI